MGFGLPIFIHIQQGDWKYNYDRSAEAAFFYLGLGLLLWGLLISLFSNKFLFSLIRTKKNQLKLKTTGRRIKAIVIYNSLIERTKDGESIVLDLEFKNLSGAIVAYSLNMHDSKPEEHRFDVGKEVNVLVSEDSKNPMITLEAGKVGWNRPILTLILMTLAVIVLIPIGLLIYGYLYESRGNGWRYLSFWHPFILAPLMGLLYVAILIFIRGYFMKPNNSDKLLLYGKSTEATILGASETGTQINDQPQILVTVEFQDNGRVIQAAYKRIYSLMSLSRLTAGQKIRIIYDAENPQNIEPNE